jgi:N-methylhydantoinase A
VADPEPLAECRPLGEPCRLDPAVDRDVVRGRTQVLTDRHDVDPARGEVGEQTFDLVVALPDGPYADDAATRAALKDAFERAYREKFALTPPNVPVEFINIRVTVRAPIAGAEMRLPLAGGTVGDAVKGVRPAYFPEANGWVDTTVYDRERLAPGFEFVGPAVVEEEGSTLVVGPGASGRVAPSGNIIVTLAP